MYKIIFGLIFGILMMVVVLAIARTYADPIHALEYMISFNIFLTVYYAIFNHRDD